MNDPQVKVLVNVVNKSDFDLPNYKTIGSSGLDVQADLKRTFNTDKGIESVFIEAGSTRVIQTGLFVEIPEDFEIQVRSRSGLSISGIVVANAPGTIDSDYRGEIGVILHNNSSMPYPIKHGDRIAQLVLAPTYKLQWKLQEKLAETTRGAGGFGHTGK